MGQTGWCSELQSCEDKPGAPTVSEPWGLHQPHTGSGYFYEAPPRTIWVPQLHTKKLCSVPAIGGAKGCQDSQGSARQEGERWEDGSAVCSCVGGVVSCTQLTIIT